MIPRSNGRQALLWGGGFGFLFGGGGRGQAPIMGPGDFLVAMTVGGQTFKQVLRVERTNGTGASAGFFEGGNRRWEMAFKEGMGNRAARRSLPYSLPRAQLAPAPRSSIVPVDPKGS